jgi:hypothetical protein
VFITSPEDALASHCARSEIDQRFSRVDPDLDLEVEPLVLLVQLGESLESGKRSADSSFGIVFVKDRSPEDRHDRVADELLDRSAVPLEARPKMLVIQNQPGSHVLRIEGASRRGRADDIHEDDGDELSFLRRRSGGCKRGSTAETEAR